jgi:hypothetical protein
MRKSGMYENMITLPQKKTARRLALSEVPGLPFFGRQPIILAKYFPWL